MEFTVKNIQVNYPEISLTVETPRVMVERAVAELHNKVLDGKHLTAEIKPYRKKRSLDANAYCWVLCQKIAEVTGTTKEEVYRKVIRDVGQFEIMSIKKDAVETFIHRWSGGGLGWFAEDAGWDVEEYRRVMAYFGSSVYNTQEMSILIEELVTTAKELDIETRPEAEINSLLKEWNNA